MRRVETFALPAFWASALINDDWSGLEQDEIDAIHAWHADAGVTPSMAVSCDEREVFKRWHAAADYVLPCMVVEFTYYVPKESN
jgi:hypothetical protein